MVAIRREKTLLFFQIKTHISPQYANGGSGVRKVIIWDTTVFILSLAANDENRAMKSFPVLRF